MPNRLVNVPQFYAESRLVHAAELIQQYARFLSLESQLWPTTKTLARAGKRGNNHTWQSRIHVIRRDYHGRAGFSDLCTHSGIKVHPKNIPSSDRLDFPHHTLHLYHSQSVTDAKS